MTVSIKICICLNGKHQRVKKKPKYMNRIQILMREIRPTLLETVSR